MKRKTIPDLDHAYAWIKTLEALVMILLVLGLIALYGIIAAFAFECIGYAAMRKCVYIVASEISGSLLAYGAIVKTKVTLDRRFRRRKRYWERNAIYDYSAAELFHHYYSHCGKNSALTPTGNILAFIKMDDSMTVHTAIMGWCERNGIPFLDDNGQIMFIEDGQSWKGVNGVKLLDGRIALYESIPTYRDISAFSG